MGKHHLLKTKSSYFWDVVRGAKTFELRKDDRDFQAGDTLNLAETEEIGEMFTGFSLAVEVLYVLHGPIFGLEEDHCIMAIRPYKGKALRILQTYQEEQESEKERSKWREELAADN